MLVVLAGGVFATTENTIVLTLAAIVGTISPSGSEVGPFLSIEQAAISQEVSAADRTRVFGYYQLTGSLSNALGALAGGWLARIVTSHGHTQLDAFRAVLLVYAALGIVMAALFFGLSVTSSRSITSARASASTAPAARSRPSPRSSPSTRSGPASRSRRSSPTGSTAASAQTSASSAPSSSRRTSSRASPRSSALRSRSASAS